MLRVSLENENPVKDLMKAIYFHKKLLNPTTGQYYKVKTIRKKIDQIRNILNNKHHIFRSTVRFGFTFK